MHMLRGKSIVMLLNKCMEFFSEDYLAHHGVKGMRWGVRRYQDRAQKLRARAGDANKWANVYNTNAADYRSKAASAHGPGKHVKKAINKYGEIANKNLAKASSRDANKYLKKARKTDAKAQKKANIAEGKRLYKSRGMAGTLQVYNYKTGKVSNTYVDKFGKAYRGQDAQKLASYMNERNKKIVMAWIGTMTAVPAATAATVYAMDYLEKRR